MSEFLKLCVGILTSPKGTVQKILISNNWSYALGALAVYLVPYYGLNLYLALNDFLPNAPSVLPISRESYYQWQLLFGCPIGLLGWYLLPLNNWWFARKLGGKGNLSEMALLMAFSFFLPMIPTLWLVETCLAFLGPQYWGTNIQPPQFLNLFLNGYLISGISLALVICSIAVSVVSELRWWKSWVTVIIGASPAFTLMGLTIR